MFLFFIVFILIPDVAGPLTFHGLELAEKTVWVGHSLMFPYVRVPIDGTLFGLALLACIGIPIGMSGFILIHYLPVSWFIVCSK